MEKYTKDKVGEWGNCETGRPVSEEVPSCKHCFSTKRLTKHHLVPKSARRLKSVKYLLPDYNPNYKMVLCERCHVQLHQIRTNKQLALQFNTPEKVLELLRRYENSSAYERLNRLRFDEYADVYEGSNIWN